MRRSTAAVLLPAQVLLLALTLTACQFMSPVESMHDDDTNGTVSADLGAVDLRDAVIITEQRDGDVELGSFIFTAMNASMRPRQLTIQAGRDGTPLAMTIPPRGQISRGEHPGSQQLLISDIGVPAGGLAEVHVSTGRGASKVLYVPILTTQLPEYAQLGPAPTEPTIVEQ